MSLRREQVAYRKAIRAAFLPWNQRLEERAAASTSKLGLSAACLDSRPKPCTVSTQFDGLRPSCFTIGARCSGIAPRLSARSSRPVQSSSMKCGTDGRCGHGLGCRFSQCQFTEPGVGAIASLDRAVFLIGSQSGRDLAHAPDPVAARDRRRGERRLRGTHLSPAPL